MMSRTSMPARCCCCCCCCCCGGSAAAGAEATADAPLLGCRLGGPRDASSESSRTKAACAHIPPTLPQTSRSFHLEIFNLQRPPLGWLSVERALPVAQQCCIRWALHTCARETCSTWPRGVVMDWVGPRTPSWGGPPSAYRQAGPPVCLQCCFRVANDRVYVIVMLLTVLHW